MSEHIGLGEEDAADLLLTAVNACASLMARKPDGRPTIPMRQQHRTTFLNIGARGGGSIREQLVSIPDVLSGPPFSDDSYKGLPAVQAWALRLYDAHTGLHPLTTKYSRIDATNQGISTPFDILLVRDPIVHCLKAWSNGVHAETVAAKTATEILHDLKRKEWPIVVLAPVENFTCDAASPIQVDDTLRLRRLSADERSALVDSFLGGIGHTKYTALRTEWALEQDWTLPVGAPIDDEAARIRLDGFVTLLRLLGAGRMGYRTTHLLAGGWGNQAGGSVAGHPRLVPTGGHRGVPYHLAASTVPQVLADWRELREVLGAATPKDLRTALKSYADSYARQQHDDELVDFVIAMEAALVAVQENELSFRLALRGACLIAPNATSREGIFEDLRFAYRLRSKLVHGTETVVDAKLAERTRKMCASVLLSFIRCRARHAWTAAEVRSKLDSFALSALGSFPRSDASPPTTSVERA